jgi:murein DD-endopeptidase MepM/ murein hydrolase activator NlpD
VRGTILWTGGARAFTVGVALLLAILLWIVATALPATMLSGTTLAQASNTVTLNPTSGPSGTKVNAIGKGWPHGVVNVAWDGKWLPEETQADAAGNFTLPFTVPQNATPGSHTVSFDGQQGSWADVRFTVTETSGKDNTKPGGRWDSPAKNFVVTGKDKVHFKARAYDSGGSGVAKVIFTAWWPGINPKVWHETCTKFRPTSGNVYECDLNPSGVPNGPLMVSFDVYDKAGNKNLAPNGLRKGKVERNYAFKFPWDSSKRLNLTSGPHVWEGSKRSGLDFSDQNNNKSTRILAMAGGTVTWAGEKQGACRSLSGEKLNCNMVEVSHSNGWEVWYVHLSSIASDIEKKCSGKEICSYPVKQGQWLGNEGDSGAPGQVHLHIELRKDGKPHEWSEVSGGIEGWAFHTGEDCSSYDPKKAAYDEKTGKQQTKACEKGNRGGFMSYGSIHALREYQSGPRYWVHSTNREP